LPQVPDAVAARGPPDDGILHDDDPLPLQQGLDRVELDPDPEIPDRLVG
jgi:hypothetical protein